MKSKGARYNGAPQISKGAPSPLSNTRIGFVFFAICGFTLFLMVRLAQLTVYESDKLRDRAQRQMRSVMELGAQRGLIRDREGNNLAINIPAKSVYVIVNQLEDPESLAGELTDLLDDDYQRIFKLITNNEGFVWIARQVDEEIDFTEIMALYPQVGVVKESKRFYPDGGFAPQLVGFAGVDNQGLWGVEFAFDALLGGTAGRLELLRDATRNAIPNSGNIVRQKQDGHTLILTLDPVIQHIAQKELDAVVEAYKARGGVVIVINPRSGEIYAMASNPSFDANDFAEYNKESYRNRGISLIVEPGSTVKPLLMALAVSQGLNPYEARYNCQGRYQIGSKYVRDVNSKHYGYLSLESIVIKSSNIGAAQVALELGQDRIEPFLRKLGFGVATDIDLPGEEKGLFPPEKKWPEVTLANIGFGQGIAVTPLQLVQAFTIFANDGVMVAPYLIQRVESADGRQVWNTHLDQRTEIVAPENARIIRDILIKVIKEGTGKQADVPGYTVAGKTGTSQKPDRNGVGYDLDRFMSSFIGFIPAYDPRLLILVMIDEPEGRAFGGTVAAPVFASIAQEAVLHLRIMPEVQTVSRGGGSHE